MLYPLSGTLNPLGASRAPAVAAFSPADVAGLQLWLEADRITGLADGDPVALWPDTSGLGNVAVQATAAKRPTCKADGIGGKPSLRCLAAAGQRLELATVFPAPFTFFGLARIDGPAAARVFAGYSANELIGWHGGAMDRYLIGSLASFGGSPVDAAPHLYEVRMSAPYGAATWRDGATGPTSGGAASDLHGLRLGGGWNGDPEAEFSDCTIAVVLVYDSALADADRTAIETYLMTKY